MNAKQIRGWLLRQPRPHSLRLQLPDGSSSEVEIGGQSLVSIAESVVALAPEVLEGLDAKGKLLRAVRPAELTDDDGASSSSSAPSSSAAPGVPPNADGETARFAMVARLIADAYRHSTDVAFQRMVDLVEAMNQRADATERAREALYKAQVRNLEDQLRALGEEPREGGDLLSQMLGMFMGGATAPTPTNGASNGAHGASNGASNGAKAPPKA